MNEKLVYTKNIHISPYAIEVKEIYNEIKNSNLRREHKQELKKILFKDLIILSYITVYESYKDLEINKEFLDFIYVLRQNFCHFKLNHEKSNSVNVNMYNRDEKIKVNVSFCRTIHCYENNEENDYIGIEFNILELDKINKDQWFGYFTSFNFIETRPGRSSMSCGDDITSVSISLSIDLLEFIDYLIHQKFIVKNYVNTK